MNAKSLSAIFSALIPVSIDVPDILIVGCGTGNEIDALFSSGLECNITGIDPSPEILQIAESKLGKHHKLKLINGVANDLQNGLTFQVTTLMLVLHFIPDNGEKLMLLKEIAVKLDQNATLLIVDIFGEKNEIDLNLSILKNHLRSKIHAEKLVARLERIRNKIHYIDENRLSELCQLAGFSQPIRIHQSMIFAGWVVSRL